MPNMPPLTDASSSVTECASNVCGSVCIDETEGSDTAVDFSTQMALPKLEGPAVNNVSEVCDSLPLLEDGFSTEEHMIDDVIDHVNLYDDPAALVEYITNSYKKLDGILTRVCGFVFLSHVAQ